MRIVQVVIISLIAAVSVVGQQALKPGDQAPNFAGQAMDGRSLSLAELQGKVVVLTFWSTRCAICHEEIPKLNRVVERYKDKDVVFLAVTMENQVKVEPYLRKTPFNYSIVPNGFGVLLQYADKDRAGNINMGFPAHFLIDQNGSIAMRTYGWDKAENLDSRIAKLLTARTH